MKKFGLYLKLFYYLFKLTRNPENTPAVLKLSPILVRLGLIESAREAIQPHESELTSENYFLKQVDLQQLRNLPAGTLGAVYAEHMLSNNLDPNFYGVMPSVGESSKIIFRLRQTHDLCHVLTGFSTSVQDELGLQAFLYAQVRSPLSPILIGAAFLKAGLTANPYIHVIFYRILLGWKMGSDAKNIYSLDWDANWSTPLEELRRRYDVQAVTPSLENFRTPSVALTSLKMRTAQ